MMSHNQLMEMTKDIVATAISNGYSRISAGGDPVSQNKQYREEIDKLFNSVYETLRTLNAKGE